MGVVMARVLTLLLAAALWDGASLPKQQQPPSIFGCAAATADINLEQQSQEAMDWINESSSKGGETDNDQYGDGKMWKWGAGSTPYVSVNVDDVAVGLSPDFYAASCPDVYDAIERHLTPIIRSNPGQAAGLLRIFFHDCFVQGCDASILLLTPPSELVDPPNNQSIRISSLLLLEEVKDRLERLCPGVVSCADTVALSAAIAIRLVGGPSIPVGTGRRDSIYPALNQTVVDSIPLPSHSITNLKRIFMEHGLNAIDLVALSGAHSIGHAHCRVVDAQLTSGEMEPDFAAELARICLPANNPEKQTQTVHLNWLRPDTFDNAYFQNVLDRRVVFHSDAQLLNATDTCQLVELFADSLPLFFRQFTLSLLKMSRIGVLTGDRGVIRRKCSTAFDFP